MAIGLKKSDNITEGDMDKVRTTLRQFVRDWAPEGKRERDGAYTPILEALENIYKDVSVEDRSVACFNLPFVGISY
jgi:carnosine N-methyltransferase